ncbi:MAG: hypothetical protein NC340_10570 [Ruminococcus flavefaciens]|nr:hypothetical protein [Ruminococcus flavefaciens]MCM1229857.1 hypothetical protein [Ruminococcus flavefaciens]
MDMFRNMFGKIAPGMCRLSMNGDIAVKTSNGYKTYDVATSRLTNCSNFVFNTGEDFFFLLPAKKVSAGDIILVGGKPRCVIKKDGDIITAINFEDSTIENIIPERYIFMGNSYFFGKIVSVFGNNKKKKGLGKIMKYMMLSEMLGKNSAGSTSSMNPMMLMAMSGNGFGDMFDDMFEDDDDDDLKGED